MKRIISAFGLYIFPALVFSQAQPLPQIDEESLRGSTYKYVSSEKWEQYPVPVVSVLRPGLMRELIPQIVEKIVTPIVRENKIAPIAAIVIEFYPKNRSEFGLDIIYADPRFYYEGAIISLEKDGGINDSTYKQWFQ